MTATPGATVRPAASTTFVMVHDDRFAPEAEQLAKLLFLEALPLDGLVAASLAGVANLVVYIDLHDLKTVQAFRSRLGKAPPNSRRWAFFVPGDAGRRAWQVQADALGATSHLNRDNARSELWRFLSIAGRPPLDPARVADLRKAHGGQSILAAGTELATLFGSLASGESAAAERISAVGRDVTRSVGSVGADDWLGTVRNYHEGTFQHCLLVTGVTAGYVNRHIHRPADAERLTTAALLHDIGKAVVPLHILDKPGRLTEEEFTAIKAHPAAGHAHLVKQPGIDPQVLDAVRHHHEALDGSGYPDRLGGDQIAGLTRILTVCDIFAALVEARSYKPPRPPAEAISILVKMAFENKVDYAVVRNLAEVFDMHPPQTLAEVERNLSAG